jgi:hypothetical protein
MARLVLKRLEALTHFSPTLLTFEEHPGASHALA